MLRNKTVVVTGAAKGIGRAIALEFAKEGANIVLNYRSSIDESLISEIEDFGVSCLAIKGDVSNINDAEELIKSAFDKYGSIDVLINNAGITRDGLIFRMTEQQFDDVINTNLKGAFNTIKFASNIMIKQKSGCIINISSVVGIIGNAGQSNYAASKAGIIGITKSVARELGIKGIRCNAIAPGYIETDMTEGLKPNIKEVMLSTIPLKRFGKGQDVAEAAVFLASHNYITGQVLNVDGGMVMY